MVCVQYLEIFLFDLELHIVFGDFETDDSLVVLCQHLSDILYSKSCSDSTYSNSHNIQGAVKIYVQIQVEA